MSIPLIQKPEKDDINTSIIAIKRNIERINMLLGLVDNDSPDLSGFATKQELQDAVTELQPVDEVTSGNMHSVTSNAVAEVTTKIISWKQSGISCFRVGKVRFVQVVKSLSGSSPVTVDTIPEDFRASYDIRGVLIRNDNDQPCGQGVLSPDGQIRAWLQNGGNFSGTYVLIFSFIKDN